MRDSAAQNSATVDSDEPLACTVREAARLLSVGTRKIEYLIQTGELESVKIGRARRIPREAIHSYFEKLRTAA